MMVITVKNIIIIMMAIIMKIIMKVIIITIKNIQKEIINIIINPNTIKIVQMPTIKKAKINLKNKNQLISSHRSKLK